MVDERLPLLRAQVLAEQVADERLHLGVVREQDVRPEVEDVAVDVDRCARDRPARVSFSSTIQSRLARLLQRVGGRQAGEPRAEHDVVAFSHASDRVLEWPREET